MRRPLKPFVTEYKASNRRNPGAPSEQGVFDGERPPPKSFDFMMKLEAEDSFDAAMRAADALFSIPSPKKAIDHDEDVTHALSDGGNAQPSDKNGTEKSGGRILRVLDEEPQPEYAALEAEHAPKRRGRKPGSKNKPKAIDKPKAIATALPPHDAPSPRAPRVVAIPVITTPALPAARKIQAILATAAPTNGTNASRNGKRFAWVRDKLKPGEDWKRRRLPRICW